MSSLTDPLGPDLTVTLRALKLGKLTATLPERLTLARQQNMPHADFLQLILSNEVARREAGSIALRARNAGLDPAMRTETWDPTAAIRYDQRLWNELVSLRFLDGPHGALILGPVGVGKTHLATALGHIAVRRRRPGQPGPLNTTTSLTSILARPHRLPRVSGRLFARSARRLRLLSVTGFPVSFRPRLAMFALLPTTRA